MEQTAKIVSSSMFILKNLDILPIWILELGFCTDVIIPSGACGNGNCTDCSTDADPYCYYCNCSDGSSGQSCTEESITTTGRFHINYKCSMISIML